MATVSAEMSMSLDGFIADPSDGIDHLFGWYSNGDTEFMTPGAPMTFRTSEASAEYLRDTSPSNALTPGYWTRSW